MDAKMEHIVSCSVLRTIPRHVYENERSMLGTHFEDGSFVVGLPEDLESQWVGSLSMGPVYLGETLTFLIRATNDSVADPVIDIQLIGELQTPSQRMIPLCTVLRDNGLQPKDSLHSSMLHHEAKELGHHVLIVTTSYTSVSTREKKVIRRFYKFIVDKPLDVKTKFYNAENDEVYLEATLQNLTVGSLEMECVSLEPSQYFNVVQLNYIPIKGEDQWVFGKDRQFHPKDSRQYLFCLTPKLDIINDPRQLQSVTSIGKLDIKWLSKLGERGHLQTSTLERMAQIHNVLRLSVEKIPSVVSVGEPFDVVCRLINCSDTQIAPMIHFKNTLQPSDHQQEAHEQELPKILWLGVSGVRMEDLPPNGTISFSMRCYPIEKGMHPLARILIRDSVNEAIQKEFTDFAYVYVTDSPEEEEEEEKKKSCLDKCSHLLGNMSIRV